MVWICAYCGSTDVTQDATVDPNTKEVIVLFDSYDCQDCGGSTSLAWRELNTTDGADDGNQQ